MKRLPLLLVLLLVAGAVFLGCSYNQPIWLPVNYPWYYGYPQPHFQAVPTAPAMYGSAPPTISDFDMFAVQAHLAVS